jgi:hypothetical protein
MIKSVMASKESYGNWLSSRQNPSVWEVDLLDYAGNVSSDDEDVYFFAAMDCNRAHGEITDKNERTALLFERIHAAREEDAKRAAERKWHRDMLEKRERQIYGVLRIAKPFIVVGMIFTIFYLVDKVMKFFAS